MTHQQRMNTDVAVLAGLPATTAFDATVRLHDSGCSITVGEVLAKADAMRNELLAARYFYRNSSEARGKRIERLEWMLDELIASSAAGLATSGGWAGGFDHDQIIDDLAGRYEAAHAQVPARSS
jgi:hypothetical protein